MNDLGYTQLIKEDTRITQTSSNLIDLIFTNSPHRVTQSGVLNLSLSDHYMIFCNRTCKLPRSKPKVLNVRSFKNFNPTAFQDDLRNLPWDIIYLFDSPDDAWFAMEQLLSDVGNKHAPLRTMRVRGDQPQWMTDEIRIAMKTRDYPKHKASKDKLEKDWNDYKLNMNI